MDTQTKFESALASMAESEKVDLIIDKSYANMGTYSFQPRGRFEPLFAFPFSWSEDRGSFDLRSAKHGPNVQSLCELVGSSQANPAGIWNGVTGADLDDAIARIHGKLMEVLDERHGELVKQFSS
jgi:hypothetical protein